MIYKANDKFRTELRATWISDPADTSLLVRAVPDNVPTIVTLGWGTDQEIVFSVEGKSGDSSSNYALTGVTRLKGANVNLAENTAVNCLNHEEFFNQYSEFVNDEYLQMEEQASAPATPATDHMRLYAKDNKWWAKNDAGDENELGAVDANEVNIDYLNRQAIINGNFDVWQRGTSKAILDLTLTFLADRWRDVANKDGGTSPTLTRSRQLLTSGDINNAFYYSRLTTNGAGASLGTSSYFQFLQKIEHGTRFLCGADKKITVSFWAKSDISNKRICPTFVQNYGTGGSPTSQEIIKGTPITLTSNWTKYTATFTTNTLVGKTFGTNNNDSLQLAIYLMWGAVIGNSDVQTGVSVETYVGAGNIDIAQVQLCAGDVALPFQPKSFVQELADCQRYYEKSYIYGTTPGTASTTLQGYYLSGVNSSDHTMQFRPVFKVKKRTTPTIVTYANSGNSGKVNMDSGEVTPIINLISDTNFNVQADNGTTSTIRKLNLHWTADAEL